MKTVYFVRHGESEFNALVPPRVGGRCSWAELTPHGIEQARSVGRRMVEEGWPVDKVVASTAVRAQQSARYCLEVAGRSLNAVDTYSDLEELHQGDFSGRLRSDVYTPEHLAVLARDQWGFRPPNGESQSDLCKRAVDWLDRFVIQRSFQHTWVFCHGMLIKVTLTGLLGLDRQAAWKIPIDNASITILTFDRQKWSEVVRNDSAHAHT